MRHLPYPSSRRLRNHCRRGNRKISRARVWGEPKQNSVSRRWWEHGTHEPTTTAVACTGLSQSTSQHGGKGLREELWVVVACRESVFSMCGSGYVKHTPVDDPISRNVWTEKDWSWWVIKLKKKDDTSCGTQEWIWEHLRGGIGGEYNQNTLYEILKKIN